MPAQTTSRVESAAPTSGAAYQMELMLREASPFGQPGAMRCSQ
jgi:hypothetical protein